MAEQRQGYSAAHLDINTLADGALNRFSEKYSKIWRSFSPVQRTRTLEDFRTQIRYLQESLATGGTAIFIDYVAWARALFRSEGRSKDYLRSMLVVLREALQEGFPPDFSENAEAIIKESLKILKKGTEETPSFITEDNLLSAVAHAYLDTLIAADQEKARGIIEKAVESGAAIRDIYLKVLQPVLWETGRLWNLGNVTIAQEHYVTASVQSAIALLHERIIASTGKTRRKGKTLVAACVGDELHDVGIRMVADFFAMDGWDTYYIGGNIPARSLIRAVGERKADLVAISTTMPFHIPAVHYLIRSLRGDPKTEKVKIIVGGYPFSIVPGLWKQLGADAVAKDAEEAVTIGNELTSTEATKRTRKRG